MPHEDVESQISELEPKVEAPTTEIEEILRHDPFSPPPETKLEATRSDPASGSKTKERMEKAKAERDGVQADPNPVEAPVTPIAEQEPEASVQDPEPEPTTDDGELGLLRQTAQEQRNQIAQLTQSVTQLTQNMQAQAQAPAQTPGQAPAQAPGQDLPVYNFTLPADLINMIDSDEPATRHQGLTALATGVARTVHQQMRTEFNARIEQIQSEVPQTISTQVAAHQQQQTEAQRVEGDFYGRYPQFNTPELKGLVVSVAQEVMGQSGASQWTPQLRDAIAARMQSIMSGAAQARQPVAQPAVQAGLGGNGVRPPVQTSPTTRPSVQPGGPNSHLDIMDTVFGPRG